MLEPTLSGIGAISEAGFGATAASTYASKQEPAASEIAFALLESDTASNTATAMSSGAVASVRQSGSVGNHSLTALVLRTGMGLLWDFIPPLLLLVGTFGNALTVVVLLRSTLRHQVTTIYLVTLACVDVVVLYTGLLRVWLIQLTDFDIRALSPSICRLHTFLVYVSLNYSAWILSLVTMERYICVWFPLHSKIWCTRRKTIMLLTFALLVLSLINGHWFASTGNVKRASYEISGRVTLNYSDCELVDEFRPFVLQVFPHIDMITFTLVPFGVILTFNSLIISKLRRSHGLRRRGSCVSGGVKDQQISSVTVMLVMVSFLFVITTLPISVFQLIEERLYAAVESHEQHLRLNLVYCVCTLLQYSSNACNFVFYCLSGSRFRVEVITIVQSTVWPSNVCSRLHTNPLQGLRALENSSLVQQNRPDRRRCLEGDADHENVTLHLLSSAECGRNPTSVTTSCVTASAKPSETALVTMLRNPHFSKCSGSVVFKVNHSSKGKETPPLATVDSPGSSFSEDTAQTKSNLPD